MRTLFEHLINAIFYVKKKQLCTHTVFYIKAELFNAYYLHGNMNMAKGNIQHKIVN